MTKKTNQMDFKRTPASHHHPLKKAQAFSPSKKWKSLIILGILLAGLAFLVAHFTPASHPDTTDSKTTQEAPKIKTVTISLPPISDPGLSKPTA